MIVVGSGLLRPKQMRLNELFTVERVLSSRGFRVCGEGDGFDTLLAKNRWSTEEADLVFEIFDDRNARRLLLKLIDESQLQYEDERVQKLVNSGGTNMTREAFSHTFEWYVGELLVRRFGAFSSSYGVHVADISRNSDGGTSGDYDVLSILGSMDLLYIECKTGNFSSKKIINMLERMRSLHALAAIMFIDHFSINSLKAQVNNIGYPGLPRRPEMYSASIKNIPGSEIYQLHDAFFVSADKESLNVETKLKAVLRLIQCKKAELNNGVGVDEEGYRGAGYEIKLILDRGA